VSLDCARSAADCAYNCAADYYPTLVTIEVQEWSGERVGDGQMTVLSELVLSRRPVKQVSLREIHGSGGFYRSGDVKVENITPFFTRADDTTGGYTQLQLDPKRAFGSSNVKRRVRYRLAGDIEGLYSLLELDTSETTAWSMLLRKTNEAA
jgi:hypothetical protein